MKQRITLLFCLLAGLARAEGYLDAAAVFSRLDAPGINDRDQANGAALEGGWKFGQAGRHAVTLGWQAVQWSDAYSSLTALSGTSIDVHTERTRLETFLAGYAWETPLAEKWRLRLAAGAGFGRIREDTESVVTFSGNPVPTVERRSDSESSKFCGRIGADVRWLFSRRGHLLFGAEWLRKEADDGPTNLYRPFGAVTAVSAKIGLGFRW